MLFLILQLISHLSIYFQKTQKSINMKKLFYVLALLFFVFASGCHKDSSITSTINKDVNNVSTTNFKYIYKDTVTVPIVTSNKDSKLTINESTPSSVVISVTYVGSGKYTISAHVNSDPNNSGVYYNLVGNQHTYGLSGTVYDASPQTNTYTLPPDSYHVAAFWQNATGYINEYDSKIFTIVNAPQAPSGMVCLMRYFNSTNGQHLCTTDWEELASLSQNFTFEKVIGYLSTTGSPCCAAPTMKPIVRYYNHTTGGHLTTDNNSGNISGYVLEKTLGYAGIYWTENMSGTVTNWHYSAIDDHFSCAAPEVPNGSSYVQDIDFTIGYIKPAN
jgi:hypothetical protein